MTGPSAEALLEAAREIIGKTRYCMAATAAGDGGANARVVQPLPPDADWAVAFVTSAGSRKVAEIWRTGRLTLAYQHDPDGAYVALVGGARVETDPAAKARAWSPGLDRWFPAGQADPDAVVVLLEAERLEMWSLAHNAMAAPRGLRAVVLARERAGWRVLAG